MTLAGLQPLTPIRAPHPTLVFPQSLRPGPAGHDSAQVLDADSPEVVTHLGDLGESPVRSDAGASHHLAAAATNPPAARDADPGRAIVPFDPDAVTPRVDEAGDSDPCPGTPKDQPDMPQSTLRQAQPAITLAKSLEARVKLDAIIANNAEMPRWMLIAHYIHDLPAAEGLSHIIKANMLYLLYAGPENPIAFVHHKNESLWFFFGT